MKASFAHLGINVSSEAKSFPFWKDLMRFLGYKVIHEMPGFFGAMNGEQSFWFTVTEKKYTKAGYHRKQTGLTHLAFKVASKKAVDQFAEKFLRPRKMKTLYNTPKAFPEYTKKYYAVFFEDVDRIKIEVCHHE